MKNKVVVDNFHCTWCQAKKGEKCKTPSGKYRNEPHSWRMEQAIIHKMFFNFKI